MRKDLRDQAIALEEEGGKDNEVRTIAIRSDSPNASDLALADDLNYDDSQTV